MRRDGGFVRNHKNGIRALPKNGPVGHDEKVARAETENQNQTGPLGSALDKRRDAAQAAPRT
jgi:hypothetical protein